MLMFELDSIGVLGRTRVLGPRGVVQRNVASVLHVTRAWTDARLLALLVAVITVVAGTHDGVLAVDLHVFPQGGGVGVGLVTAPRPAVVRLVRGVDVHVLLTIAGVGESSVASLDLAFKGLLT